MITLPNGSIFVIDGSELDDVNCVFEDLVNIEVREFFDKITTNSYLPLKYNNGKWHTNFNIFDDLFDVVAVAKVEQELFSVYEMPWGEVYLIDYSFDFEEGDYITKFANRSEYMASVTLPEPKINPENIQIDVRQIVTIRSNGVLSFYEFNSQTQVCDHLLNKEIRDFGTVLGKDLSGEETYFDVYYYKNELYVVSKSITIKDSFFAVYVYKLIKVQ